MEKLIRRIKLHAKMQFVEEGDPAHLIAISNIRLDTTQCDHLWLLFDTEPSLRTARKQQAMHGQAHEWAQSPDTLRSIKMPSIVEDLWDGRQGTAEDADWNLRVEMPGYGSCSYCVRPVFETAIVTFNVLEFLGNR